MPVLRIHFANGKPLEIEAAAGSLLSAVLAGANQHIPLPCGGNGRCGKCIVFVRGNCTSDTPCADETRLLARQAALASVPAGYHLRLACYCKLEGDMDIMLPPEKGRIAMANSQITVETEGEAGLGAAVDIGTTTITLLLYRLDNAQLLHTVHQLNRQTAFGADVLSRISYSNENGCSALTDCIRSQLQDMLGEALASTNEQNTAAELKRVVVTANTTMLHYLAGLDPKGIGVSPFTPQSLFGEAASANTILGGRYAHAQLLLPRCVSAYIGADISCGMPALNTHADKGAILLVDIGTNGEMALLNNGELSCCSTAAGPAFEGAQISMGMPAQPGAISRVSLENGVITPHTIGGKAPVGLCGTGLISVTAFMLAHDILDFSGRIAESGHAFTQFITMQNNQPAFQIGESGVSITQEDIREIQLAKAAICAGIETLLHEAACEAGHLVLSGGFGSTIDPEEAAAIGLIPAALSAKAAAGGNTALAGAAAALFSSKAYAEINNCAKAARDIPLATHPFFMAQYMDNMLFDVE